MTFNNNASHVGFIGNYNSVEDVIIADRKELEEIGGNFEAIASRMEKIVNFAIENMRHLPKTMDNKIRVIEYIATRGMQECPYEECDYEGQKIKGWNEDIPIINPSSGKELVINSGTTHLVRVHNLLEKGNKYGISVKEFYEHFMME